MRGPGYRHLAEYLLLRLVRALRGMRLFDGVDVVDRPVVVIDRGTIVAVGDVEPGIEVEDLGDVTLMPGLVDAHQHLCFDGNGTLEEQVAGIDDAALRQRARGAARAALLGGVTTLRDLGDRNFVTLDLRGDPALPTILAAGPPLTPEGGHCWYLGGCCTGTDELVAAVEERATRRCDVVKVMLTGGNLTPTFPMWKSQFSDDELQAVVDAAHARGLPVAAHCHGRDGIASAVDARVDSIEHCTFFGDSGLAEPSDDLIDKVARSGIAISVSVGSTVDVPANPVIAANLTTIVETIGAMHARGGNVVVGTDAGIAPAKPHDVIRHAPRALALAGVTGVESLRMITSRPAAACGVGDRKGRLAPGFDADVIAVAGDPLTGGETIDVVAVWRAGERIR